MTAVHELTADLIRIPTVAPPGDEEQCASFIKDYIEDLGIDECHIELHKFAEKRANLVCRIGPRGKAGILLSGHMDVVPAGELSLWDTKPFEPVVREGKLYGRGATDMKGSIAAMMKAIELLRGSRLKKGVIFIATSGEEIGCDGLEKLVSDGVLKRGEAEYAIVGEPSGLTPFRSHRGLAWVKVLFQGRNAHSSCPDLGINAVEYAADFITKLKLLRDTKLKLLRDAELGSSTVSATIVRGGVKENIIPDNCELIVDCRYIATQSEDFLLNSLLGIADQLTSVEPKLKINMEVTLRYGALNTPKDHPLVKIAEEVTGKKSEAAPYSTEAPIYQRLEIPTIILGPGNIAQAHTYNEYIEIRQLEDAVKIYSELIRRFCL